MSRRDVRGGIPVRRHGLRIFEYPRLAMVPFLAAAAGGFSLVGSIFMSDRKPRER